MPFLAPSYPMKRKEELSTAHKMSFLIAHVKSLSNGSLPNCRKLYIREQATQKFILKLFILVNVYGCISLTLISLLPSHSSACSKLMEPQEEILPQKSEPGEAPATRLGQDCIIGPQ